MGACPSVRPPWHYHLLHNKRQSSAAEVMGKEEKLGWAQSSPLPLEIIEAWLKWEFVSIPRTYAPSQAATETTEHTLHILCEHAEHAYGSVAYFTTRINITAHVSFIMARSRVAQKRKQTMPRGELCATLELSWPPSSTRADCEHNQHLWTDSTIVITWLTSESDSWFSLEQELQRSTRTGGMWTQWPIQIMI